MYRDLLSFVSALEQAGELVRVSTRVSPVLEVAHIADRVSKAAAPNLPSEDAKRSDPRFADRGGPAILFENVEGSKFPILINAFGSYRRMELAFGERSFDAIGQTIGELVKPEPPRSLAEAIAKAKQFAPLLKISPKRLKGRGPCQQVVERGDDIDLTTWPIIRCWPADGDFEAVGYPAGVNAGVPDLGHDGIPETKWDEKYRGRYITLAGIHTIHADDRNDPKPKSHNIGMYRVQLLGKDRVAMHWHMHHDGASHWRSWKKLGEPMPVAIVLGGPSVMPYAATCPLPPGISELLMAGFLQGGGIRLCRGVSVPLWLPADSEMVIEGYVSPEAGFIGWDPREDSAGELGPGAVFEGPFGDHTGFYSMPDRYPVVKVTAVTHRENPIYPTTVVGLPPQEDYFLGKATERVMLPLLKTLIPDIADYDLPMFGAFHNCAFVQIKKHYPLHARRVMHGIWGAGQMSWTKSLFIVDDSVDVHDHFAVLRVAAAYCAPMRDIERVNGPLDILDHAAPRLGVGTKFGFDCTPKHPDEALAGMAFEQPRTFAGDDDAEVLAAIAGIEKIEQVLGASRCSQAPGWLFVSVDRGYDEPAGEGLGQRVIEQIQQERLLASGRVCAFVIVVGRDVDLADPDAVLFHWLANSDAGRDEHLGEDPMGGWLAFDATPKTPGDARNGDPVRAWPPILRLDPEVQARVRDSWDGYGLGCELPAE